MDKIPLGTSVLVGLQHISAMVVGTITPPLIVAGTLKFSPTDTACLVSIALLASAFGTCRQRGLVDSGLLSVTGTSFAFQALAVAGQVGGLPLIARTRAGHGTSCCRASSTRTITSTRRSRVQGQPKIYREEEVLRGALNFREKSQFRNGQNLKNSRKKTAATR